MRLIDLTTLLSEMSVKIKPLMKFTYFQFLIFEHL